MVKYTDEDQTTYYEVLHPLDDVPEQKLSYKDVGLIRMTPTVRLSLMALRVYLLLMIALVFYRVLQETGLFGGKH